MDCALPPAEQISLKSYSDAATQVAQLNEVVKELVLRLLPALQGTASPEDLHARLHLSLLQGSDSFEKIRGKSPDSATDSQDTSTLGTKERPLESAIQQLFKALVRRDHKSVFRILEVAPSLVNRQHEGGWFPLHAAVLTGDVELVKLILSNPNTDVTAVYEPGESETNSALLDLESELGICADGTSGASPLHYACMIGNADIIDVLMRHGALPDSLDGKKQEPIEYFNLEHDLEVAIKFRELCAERQAREDFYKKSANIDKFADLICQNNFVLFQQSVPFLVDILDILGIDKVCAARALSEFPEEASRFTYYDFTLLHLAVIHQRRSFVELLLTTCPDLINRIDDRSSYTSDNSLSSFAPPIFPHKYVKDATALHYACLTGDLDIITLLINAGADWNIKDGKGRKPEELLYPKRTDHQHVKRFFSDLCAAQEERSKPEKSQPENGDVRDDPEHIDSESSSESCESDDDSSESQRDKDDDDSPPRVPIPVAHAVRLRKAEWLDPDRPLTMLFLGSSGVGKTELAKQLALFVHGENGLATNKGERIKELEKEKAFVRIDMSEYQSSHTAYNLIGSPKSYVGYGDGGALTNPLKKNPKAIVLLDEIEKAHPDVLTLFLRVFDDGRITDSKDGVIYCKDAIFIMTSNIASDKIKERSPELRRLVAHAETEGRPELYLNAIRGFTRSIHPQLKCALKRDEFIGRINEIAVFLPLSEEEIGTVVERELGIWTKRAEEKHSITLSWSEEVVQKLATAYDINYGVRSVTHEVQRIAIHLVADAQISGRISAGYKARLSTDELGDIKLDIDPEDAPKDGLEDGPKDGPEDAEDGPEDGPEDAEDGPKETPEDGPNGTEDGTEDGPKAGPEDSPKDGPKNDPKDGPVDGTT
ncbi:uncharacterized protein FOMMEDRAFT_149744 [Fomitiporia mediterranea MF3/22]|uniref:uncharacterized protein n=1 Tax=Fomitiporia mediterranea (strain MF3/22) TaxID=694068 RepID=UPI0004407909|nr:uncharacterized protein FOMMEDRAFT_149744 [Fomitiporia mediterranea MF3/22]EJD07232.1 hypothetical protein FOMMEDRAFT_149744 [Fomitiporia mediterranea MF3/22]